MDTLMNIIQSILNMGATALLPVMICILGLIFGMKLGASIKAGLFVGIGFQGLVLVINLLTQTITPVSEYYAKLGGGFTTTDLGFATVGAASWTVPFAPIAVPLIILVNLLMLRIGWTRVMNVDIWNYIHFLIPGAMAYALTGNAWLGLLITVALSVISLVIGQKIAPQWIDTFGLDGTTCTTFSYITFMYPLSWAINKLFDVIPGLNKVDINMSKLQDKLGFFGDPCFVGLIVGIFLGLLTHQDFAGTLTIGMGLSAVLVLIPRMVTIMMEGLTPIGNAANDFMRKRVGEDKEIYIGMDIALGLGDPACITCTAICIPLTILFAFIIPNMSYFPVPLLGIVCYTSVMCVLASKGNLLRSLICTAVSMFLIAFFANFFTPEATAMMSVTGLQVEGYVTDGFFGNNIACIIIGGIARVFGL